MSYFFDGSDGIILNGGGSNTGPVNLFLSYRFALSCWFFPTDDTTSQDIISVTNSSTSDSYYINLNGASAGDPISASTWNGSTTTSAAVSNSVKFNDWNFVAARFNTNTGRGVSINASNFNANNANSSQTSQVVNSISFGASSYGAGRTFKGYIAHAAIWVNTGSTDSALVNLDVQRMYYGANPFALQKNLLIAYWPMVNPGPIVNIINAKSRLPVIFPATGGARYSNWNPPVQRLLPQETKIAFEPAAQNNSPIFYHQRQQQGMAS